METERGGWKFLNVESDIGTTGLHESKNVCTKPKDPEMY